MTGQRTKTAAETCGAGLTGLQEVNPVMGSTSIKHACQGVTDALTFTEHLKEIDRDLGLNQGIFRANVQMPAQVSTLNLNSNHSY
jgi:hypothetical protein